MAVDAVLLGVALALLLARRTGRRWWNSVRPASDTGVVSGCSALDGNCQTHLRTCLLMNSAGTHLP
jgi:hypothetical protein